MAGAGATGSEVGCECTVLNENSNLHDYSSLLDSVPDMPSGDGFRVDCNERYISVSFTPMTWRAYQAVDLLRRFAET